MQWHTITVVPDLPERLRPLQRLARNLWYTWHSDAIDLWRRLDRDLWEEVRHNPAQLLGKISQEKLEEASKDESLLLQMDRIIESLDRYMAIKTPYHYHLNNNLDPSFLVAYFSMEYGINEALPIYSGGLGILSGDHVKSASNLNLPFVGIGLLYQKGYFGQYLNTEGWQQEYYVTNDFENMPITQAKDEKGDPIEFRVTLGDREVGVNIWRGQVGRVPLYFLNTNLPENAPEDREITAYLYGGDREMRIRQEILLGIGGIRAMGCLGLSPTVFHMNEGHSAFSTLERIRQMVHNEGFSFNAAAEVVKASSVFTTHTPVPAGNDYFTAELVAKYFHKYAEEIGLSFHDFMALGRQDPNNDNEDFCMTVLAIKLANYRNGVSKLHRQVSQDMWRGIWPAFSKRDVPIVAVTNGVHIPSYLSKEIADLYDRYLGPRWIENPDNQKVWERVQLIPDTELWRTHERRRERLIAFVRRQLKNQRIRRGVMASEIKHAEDVLNPEALTICFSRRFATYKRGDLLFHDPKRLAQILNNPQCPVQIIFAGKAHPQDKEGKAIIKNVFKYSQTKEFRFNIVFLEDYDINIGRYLVQGADVWLNTPRRPMEACGTSGMKAVANGALHMSILDGWWAQGYKPSYGWAIGAGEHYKDPKEQDEIESRTIYELLEREVVPLFYDRARDGTPRGWINMMKSSMRHLCPIYNSHRMLEDYVENFYVPAFMCYQKIQEDKKQIVDNYVEWQQKIRQHWGGISVNGIEMDKGLKEIVAGTSLPVQAHINLGALSPKDVQVDLYFGILDTDGDLVNATIQPMTYEEYGGGKALRYQTSVVFKQTGKFGFALRILPKHQLLVHSCDMGLVTWG